RADRRGHRPDSPRVRHHGQGRRPVLRPHRARTGRVRGHRRPHTPPHRAHRVMTAQAADERRIRVFLRALGARPFGHQDPAMHEPDHRHVTPTRIIPAGAPLPARPPEPGEAPPWRSRRPAVARPAALPPVLCGLSPRGAWSSTARPAGAEAVVLAAYVLATAALAAAWALDPHTGRAIRRAVLVTAALGFFGVLHWSD